MAKKTKPLTISEKLADEVRAAIMSSPEPPRSMVVHEQTLTIAGKSQLVESLGIGEWLKNPGEFYQLAASCPVCGTIRSFEDIAKSPRCPIDGFEVKT